jgi:hypothetical protein
MTRVGLSPRHSVRGPSFLAIFRKPSKVLVNVLLCASSAAQACVEDVTAVFDITVILGAPATQYGALLLTQKTSRQQEEMPKFGGRFANAGDMGRVEPRGAVAAMVEGVWLCD